MLSGRRALRGQIRQLIAHFNTPAAAVSRLDQNQARAALAVLGVRSPPSAVQPTTTDKFGKSGTSGADNYSGIEIPQRPS